MLETANHSGAVAELEKTIRVLEKKLARSEKARGQIEADIIVKESLLKNVIDELQCSQQTLEQRSQDLQQAMEKMQLMQLQLIQSEKMSALGQTTAGIAHEINNPIGFIHGNLAYLGAYIKDLLQLIHLYHDHFPTLPAAIGLAHKQIDLALIEDDIPRILQSMENGSQRIRDIVLALRNFSRLDEAAYKAVDLHEGLDNTLMILQSKMAGIQVLKDYAELPLVHCAAGDLNQVFINILSNAIDAIDQRVAVAIEPLDTGIITIRTEHQSRQQVMIQIKDNGIGISPDVMHKVFDPFFTTKAIGKGTGLGLAIAHQIVVEKHGGKLAVQSIPGQGTEFCIQLPIDR